MAEDFDSRLKSIERVFESRELPGGFHFYCGRLPAELILTPAQFEAVWGLHPDEFHEIKMHGRPVKTPRWQQAYGEDYHYTGRVNRALPVPALIDPLVTWAKTSIDSRLNGVLINWYDGSLGHYIGKHHDSTRNMVKGAPIVTVSFGQERTFRLRPSEGTEYIDFRRMRRSKTSSGMCTERNRDDNDRRGVSAGALTVRQSRHRGHRRRKLLTEACLKNYRMSKHAPWPRQAPPEPRLAQGIAADTLIASANLDDAGGDVADSPAADQAHPVPARHQLEKQHHRAVQMIGIVLSVERIEREIQLSARRHEPSVRMPISNYLPLHFGSEVAYAQRAT